jgi:hypothetical protein
MRGVLKMTDFNIILFDKFEILDPFGPAEVIGNLLDSYSLIKCFGIKKTNKCVGLER